MSYTWTVGNTVVVTVRFTATVGAAPSVATLVVLSPSNVRTTVACALVAGAWLGTVALTEPGKWWIQVAGTGAGIAATEPFLVEATPGV